MKYLQGFLATHKLLQFVKLLVKSSGIEITLNEIIILATIGRGKKMVRNINISTMIDKATIVRTLIALKDKKMVSKIKIDTKTYYMLTTSAINLLEAIQDENNDSVAKLEPEERELFINCASLNIEALNIFSKYMLEY